MGDTCAFIVEMAQNKFQESGQAMLTDDEIFQCLQTFGLIRGSDKAMAKGDKEMTLKEATSIAKSQVYLDTMISSYRFFTFPSQKTNTVAVWRNLFYFLSANIDIGDALVSKIAEVNRASKEGDIIKPQLVREINALSTEDWQAFGKWLISLTTTVRRANISAKLQELKVYRLARWHVLQAPDHVVSPEKSVFPSHLDTMKSSYHSSQGLRRPSSI